jgi:hypothetical protein
MRPGEEVTKRRFLDLRVLIARRRDLLDSLSWRDIKEVEI